jgi:hypothetical protein
MTGKFDAFKDSMNKLAVEQAKNSGSEIANMNALVSVAQNDLKSCLQEIPKPFLLHQFDMMV